MPQRTSYIVLSDITADDVVWDDDHEVDAESETEILTLEVRGASAAFLATAPDEGGISNDIVAGIIVPIVDADSTELVDSIAGALDESGDIDAVDLEFDIDGGNYERFQDITLPFRVVVGTERMLVTAVVDGATEDAWTVIRGIDGTTAAIHLDNAVFAHYIGPEANIIRVDDASSFAAGDVLKVATGGTERILVTARNETTDIITIQRGLWGTTPETVIADNAQLWDVIDDVKVAAAVTSAGGLRLLEPANKYPEGDTTDSIVPLLASDYA
jgi:hypothetical protein